MLRYGFLREWGGESLASTCNQIVGSVPCLLSPTRTKSAEFMPVRYGAPRFKPNMARVLPLKTPSMLAMDHFDFYYGPMFGTKWPSIRLGLLTPHKFVAVVNRFSKNFEANKLMLKDLGTINLIETLTKSDRYQMKLDATRSAIDSQEQQISGSLSEGDAVDSNCVLDSEEEGEMHGMNTGLRTELGMMEFQQPTSDYSYADVQNVKNKRRRLTDRGDGVIRDADFQVTGLEGMGAEALPMEEDVFSYPEELTLELYGRGSLDAFPGPTSDESGISSWWLLDGGSIVPVLALDLEESDHVMDMCAAPGGKSMLIAQTGKFAKLVCNDPKLSRLGQLRRALGMYIPSDCDEVNKITIKRKDASSVENWNELERYDKVLVDAPCSTDRLSANSDHSFNLFANANTTERLALPQNQTRMVVNALRSLKIGGSLVYSTCSLSPSQNECVIENAVVLAKTYYNISCVEMSLSSWK